MHNNTPLIFQAILYFTISQRFSKAGDIINIIEQLFWFLSAKMESMNIILLHEEQNAYNIRITLYWSFFFLHYTGGPEENNYPHGIYIIHGMVCGGPI